MAPCTVGSNMDGVWQLMVPMFYFLLLVVNLLLIIACLIRGYPLNGLNRWALWVNSVFLVVMLAPALSIWFAMQDHPDAGSALPTALWLPVPLAAQLLIFGAIYRWRMRKLVAPEGRQENSPG